MIKYHGQKHIEKDFILAYGSRRKGHNGKEDIAAGDQSGKDTDHI